MLWGAPPFLFHLASSDEICWGGGGKWFLIHFYVSVLLLSFQNAALVFKIAQVSVTMLLLFYQVAFICVMEFILKTLQLLYSLQGFLFVML